MRQVTRNYNDKPRILTLNSTLAEWTMIALRKSINIKRNLYSDPYYDSNNNSASKVIDHLNKWYFLKCAYCERIYKLDVEHYRPKGEVRDLDNKIVNISHPTVGAVPHPGYYWLCYEWSNLLPACISCNRDGGKGSKFPTINSYASIPPLIGNSLNIIKCQVGDPDLIVEQPFLLHPEYDNVTNMFQFEIDDEKKGIKIVGKDALGRGQATVIICQMNRPEIRLDRLDTVVYPIKKTLLAMLKQLSHGRKTIQQIRDEVNTLLQKLYDDSKDPKLNHTYLRGYIVESEKNFSEIVIPFMPNSLRGVLLKAYQNYRPIP